MTDEPETRENTPAATTGSAINDLEAAKLLLDEWKFRQQHCWTLLPRYGFAVVIVSVTPYLRMDLFKVNRCYLWIFPVTAWLLAVAATWLFMAEQFRSHSVLVHYRDLIGSERTKRTPKGFLERKLDGIKVRRITPSIFFGGFTALSLTNLWLLYHLRWV